MAVVVCSQPGCPSLTPKGKCERHQREADHSRPRRGSTYRWRRIRAQVLERDQHRCHYCGGHADTVDHKTPVASGGTDDLSNLVAACAPCNYRKGSKP